MNLHVVMLAFGHELRVFFAVVVKPVSVALIHTLSEGRG
jgi:hypothetical protein